MSRLLIYACLSIICSLFLVACEAPVISENAAAICQEKYELNQLSMANLEQLQKTYYQKMKRSLASEFTRFEPMQKDIALVDSIQMLLQPTEKYLDSLMNILAKGKPQYQQTVLTETLWSDLRKTIKKKFVQTDTLFTQSIHQGYNNYEGEWVARFINRYQDIPENPKLQVLSNIEAQLLLSSVQLVFMRTKLNYCEGGTGYLSAYSQGSHCGGFGSLHSLSMIESNPLNPKQGAAYQLRLGVYDDWSHCFLKQNDQDSIGYWLINGQRYPLHSAHEYLDDHVLKFPRPKDGTLDSVVVEVKYEDQDGIYHHLVDTFYYQ
ncbi:MAG: hypothetical protein MK212_11880 [Saprospiraceae bacterium]|nr:hypothetical protein [Saprospiraceae bacterium]